MRVAVPAISFCQQAELVAHLLEQYPDARVNLDCVPHYRSEEDTIAFLEGCDAAIVSFEPINDRVLSALPQLKVVSKLGVGLDKIDPAAMRKHGVRLGWTAGVNRTAVAELTIALMLASLRLLLPLNLAIREGERPLQRLGRQLTGRVVGIHGCGNIGKEVVRLLNPFDCTVLACDIRDYPDFYCEYGVEPVSLDEMLDRSEIVSIHLPVTKLTLGLYNEELLAKLRPDAILINTARGRMVDEAALRNCLSTGKLAAAAFDAFAIEPPEDDQLLNLPNFIATPHIGASTAEARWRMGTTAIEGLTDNFLPEPGVYPFEDR
jgi:phosphoglycerate dehydrogenase-like enzyme